MYDDNRIITGFLLQFMDIKTIKIATRNSPLALWQANHVRDLLIKAHENLNVELVQITTRGDRMLDVSLAAFGGKGLFIKELEQALLEDHADLAVHSMKDVTIDLPDEFILPVVLKRDDPRDVFISNKFENFMDMPEGSRLGTSSLRRQCQVKSIKPELEIINLRGNVGTRLKKLDNDEYDGIILAAAGIKRLKMEDRIRQYIPVDIVLPAIGQGAIGIEIRSGDKQTLSVIEGLNDPQTAVLVSSERAFNRRLGGGCQFPVAAYATLEQNSIHLHGLAGSIDGSEIIRGEVKGPEMDAEQLGIMLAEELLQRGADRILGEYLDD